MLAPCACCGILTIGSTTFGVKLKLAGETFGELNPPCAARNVASLAVDFADAMFQAWLKAHDTICAGLPPGPGPESSAEYGVYGLYGGPITGMSDPSACRRDCNKLDAS